MKRLHLHIGVHNLKDSIQFYSKLFNAQPVKVKEDYAKWLLDDPYINFAISTRSGNIGLDHLGIQVNKAQELEVIRKQLSLANISTHSDGSTVCCYAKSEKSWVNDQNGIAWEAYYTMEDTEVYHDKVKENQACCTPETAR